MPMKRNQKGMESIQDGPGKRLRDNISSLFISQAVMIQWFQSQPVYTWISLFAMVTCDFQFFHLHSFWSLRLWPSERTVHLCTQSLAQIITVSWGIRGRVWRATCSPLSLFRNHHVSEPDAQRTRTLPSGTQNRRDGDRESSPQRTAHRQVPTSWEAAHLLGHPSLMRTRDWG